MSLLRLKIISTQLSQRHLIPNIQSISGCHVRLFASANNSRKNSTNYGMILSKNVTQAINVQPKKNQVDPWPVIVRQMSSSKSPGGFQSVPPPPQASSTLNSRTFWLSFAAVFIGGGAYLAYNLSAEEQDSVNDVFKPVQPKKAKVPLSSSEIPKEVLYLLIGGGTASFAAFRAIKSHDPKARIMVLSNEIETPYM